MSHKQEIGRIGEKYALTYLKKKGMRPIAANWRCRAGEIDLVLRDGKELVLVEVKTRVSNSKHPWHVFDNLSARKQQKLRLLSKIYLSCKFKYRKPPVRIDAVGVVLDSRLNYRLRSISYLKAAISDD